MKLVRPLPGSFRDPSGRVYEVDGRILRTVSDRFAGDFEFVQSTRLLKKLVADQVLLPFERVNTEILGTITNNVKYLLEVPRLPFISYPYEWPFPALKAAALLHLKIHLAALEYGVTLKDASAYNIQFRGAQPVFIDHLSFRRYRPGEFWAGHRQFCEQFLNPLLFRAFFGIAYNAWYRGTQEGITAADISRCLKWRHLLCLNVLTHVVLQSFFQRSAENNNVAIKKGNLPAFGLPLVRFRRMLRKLHDWINELKPANTAKTIWRDYAKTHSYSTQEVQQKRQFVVEFITQKTPGLLWDIGCNTGEYSVSALEAGAEYAVGFDFDQGALDSAFARAEEENLAFQTLFLNAANPTPNQGWRELERPGLQARASADAILALAVIHHLVITHNIPLDQLLDWIVNLAPRGVIEFVPKSDPMVQSLLRHREDIFSDYTKESFLNRVDSKAVIVKTETVSSSGRLLAWYERRLS
jgi:ribosomal protein L11 methylase PrmA